MAKLLGPSWRTTLLGVAGAAVQGIITWVIANAFPDKNEPRTWVIYGLGASSAIITALRGYFAKDKDISNAPNPLPVGSVVPSPEKPQK